MKTIKQPKVKKMFGTIEPMTGASKIKPIKTPKVKKGLTKIKKGI